MESMEEVIFPAIGLIFLLLGVVLLFQIMFAAFNPYDQIAFANAEKLRAAIDEACFRTGDVVELKSFELRQNTPAFTWLLTILPRWLIRSGGDPNYVLYYESYPPGEAIGWEIYHPFNTRLVAPLPESFSTRQGDISIDPERIENYVNAVVDKAEQEQPGVKIDSVIINNIILNSDLNPNYVLASGATQTQSGFSSGGTIEDETRRSQKFYGYGEWKYGGTGKDQFLFKNYLGLTNLDKTAIKFMPCEANSLCLKTRSGVYSFPLEHCDGIKAVHLVYDARAPALSRLLWESSMIASLPAVASVASAKAATVLGNLGFAGVLRAGKFIVTHPKWTAIVTTVGSGAIYWTVEKAAEAGGTLFLSFKTMDFGVASPCVLGGEPGFFTRLGLQPEEESYVQIVKTTCEEVETSGIWSETEYPACSRYIKYPLFRYDKEGGLRVVPDPQVPSQPKYHYACAERLGRLTDTPTDDASHTFSDSDLCVQVRIPMKAEGFCWTSDPWKDVSFWSFDTNADIKLVMGILGMTPVVDSTGFINAEGATNDVIVMKPSSEEELNDFLGRWERKLGWGWP